MGEQEQSQHDEMKFHAPVTEEDLVVNPVEPEELHPRQHAEVADTAQEVAEREALQEKLRQLTIRVGNLERWGPNKPGIRADHEQELERARDYLARQQEELREGLGQTLPEEEAAAAASAKHEEFSGLPDEAPDEELTSAVARLEEQIAEWERKVAFVTYPARLERKKRWGRIHDADGGESKGKRDEIRSRGEDPDALPEPVEPETEITAAERAEIESDEGKSKKEKLERDLADARTALQQATSKAQASRRTELGQVQAQAEAAETRGRQAKAKHEHSLRKGVEIAQERVAKLEQRLREFDREVADEHRELEEKRAEIAKLQANGYKVPAKEGREHN